MRESVLRSLYHGGVCFDSLRYDTNPSLMEAIQRKQAAYEKLLKALDAESREQFSLYSDAVDYIAESTRYSVFSSTMQFAISLMTECFIGDNDGLIEKLCPNAKHSTD